MTSKQAIEAAMEAALALAEALEVLAGEIEPAEAKLGDAEVSPGPGVRELEQVQRALRNVQTIPVTFPGPANYPPVEEFVREIEGAQEGAPERAPDPRRRRPRNTRPWNIPHIPGHISLRDFEGQTGISKGTITGWEKFGLIRLHRADAGERTYVYVPNEEAKRIRHHLMECPRRYSNTSNYIGRKLREEAGQRTPLGERRPTDVR